MNAVRAESAVEFGKKFNDKTDSTDLSSFKQAGGKSPFNKYMNSITYSKFKQNVIASPNNAMLQLLSSNQDDKKRGPTNKFSSVFSNKIIPVKHNSVAVYPGGRVSQMYAPRETVQQNIKKKVVFSKKLVEYIDISPRESPDILEPNEEESKISLKDNKTKFKGPSEKQKSGSYCCSTF